MSFYSSSTLELTSPYFGRHVAGSFPCQLAPSSFGERGINRVVITGKQNPPPCRQDGLYEALMIGKVGLILIQAAVFSGIWHIRRINVEHGLWRVPVFDALNAIDAVYLYPAKALMPKAEKFEATTPLACGGGHIVVYKGYRSSPIPLCLRHAAKPLILLDEEGPCPIYIGSVKVFDYLEGARKLCTGVGREYQPVRQLLKLALVLQYPIQIDNIAVKVIQHFYGERLRQMPKYGRGASNGST
jgi:hypothetical protein